MNITQEIRNELRRIMWDYNISDEALVSIFQGEKGTFSLKKEKLYSRLLLSVQWYKLLSLLGVDGVKELLTDGAINSIWIKSMREKFLYAREVLHEIT